MCAYGAYFTGRLLPALAVTPSILKNFTLSGDAVQRIEAYGNFTIFTKYILF